jgi:hypothetical protein
MRAEIGCSAARLRDLLRLARKRNLVLQPATKQPAGQITEMLSSPRDKNIPLHARGKSVI